MAKNARVPKPTRLATLQTWNPTTRVERILKTRRILFTGDPATLITAAAKLVPQWDPINLKLYLDATTSTPDHPRPALAVIFGYDEGDKDKVETEAWIALTDADVPLMVAYLIRLGTPMTGSISCAYVVDDDGEELPVPHILSADELAALPTSSTVPQ